MSETLAVLRRKKESAAQLESVVRTMKALAALSIKQYERSMLSLEIYSKVIELGLGVCLKGVDIKEESKAPAAFTVIVFGSDQGLVGRFNEVLEEFVTKSLEKLSGPKKIWAIGERVRLRLEDGQFPVVKSFPVPDSVTGIAPLVEQMLAEYSELLEASGVYVFRNKAHSAEVFAPTFLKILPFDDDWLGGMKAQKWPTKISPEVLSQGAKQRTLKALIHQYLFVSLFRACAESLASENAVRLAAMQRAEKNIEELLEELGKTFHRQRQNIIDEELFDVISGYEALLLNF